MEDGQDIEGAAWVDGTIKVSWLPTGEVVPQARDDEGRKKRVSIFDEQSHQLIENKDSALQTKPNEAN